MHCLKLPHAGLAIKFKNTHVICDPLLNDVTIDSGTGVVSPVYPSRKFLKETIFDAVIVSHAHNDHFHLPSLALLNRQSTIYFPEGDRQIPLLLGALGFTRFISCKPGAVYKVGQLEIIPIPSAVPFPEMGIIIKNKTVSVWNMVDARPRSKNLIALKNKFGTPTLLLAYYQCFHEDKVLHAGFNDRFPFQTYEMLLKEAGQLQPIFMCPSSADLFNKKVGWLNYHMQPVKKQQFIDDYMKLNLKSKGVLLSAGDSFRLTNKKIIPSNKLKDDFKLKYGIPISFPWSPDMGKESVRDHSKSELDINKLKSKIELFFKNEFGSAILQRKNHEIAQRLIKDQVKWRIKIIFADDTQFSYLMSFSEKRFKWRKEKRANAIVDIETHIGAGVLLDFFHGKISSYPLSTGGYVRQIDRYYRIEKNKLREGSSIFGSFSIPEIFFLEHLATPARRKFLFESAKNFGESDNAY